ncbi:MAG: sigma-70 family RNA polymerase sigma factor [Actinobacteria bacterium]|nr:MAG: sigma-70 family RNA polymerase sigma factor [Actinomycetota bacterium]
MAKVESDLSDVKLVLQAQNGDSSSYNEIFKRFKYLLRGKASNIFIIGADSEDVFQELRIGLFKAIRDYKADKNLDFKGFAEICVERQIFSAIKCAAGPKHTPLHNYSFLETPENSSENDKSLRPPNTVNDPLRKLILKEELVTVLLRIKDLSIIERRAFRLLMQGDSYQDIAVKMQLSHKSIDNALQRARLKLKGEKTN